MSFAVSLKTFFLVFGRNYLDKNHQFLPFSKMTKRFTQPTFLLIINFKFSCGKLLQNDPKMEVTWGKKSKCRRKNKFRGLRHNRISQETHKKSPICTENVSILRSLKFLEPRFQTILASQLQQNFGKFHRGTAYYAVHSRPAQNIFC